MRICGQLSFRKQPFYDMLKYLKTTIHGGSTLVCIKNLYASQKMNIFLHHLNSDSLVLYSDHIKNPNLFSINLLELLCSNHQQYWIENSIWLLYIDEQFQATAVVSRSAVLKNIWFNELLFHRELYLAPISLHFLWDGSYIERLH